MESPGLKPRNHRGFPLPTQGEGKTVSPMRRFFISGSRQAGFELGNTVIRSAQARCQPINLFLLTQHAVGQIIYDALLFSDMRFQRVEAGGVHRPYSHSMVPGGLLVTS